MEEEALRRVLARVRGEEEAAPETVETAADRLQRAVRLSGETAAVGERLRQSSLHCRTAAGKALLQAGARHQRAQTELFLLRGDTHPFEERWAAESILRLLRKWCAALKRERETYEAFLLREGETLRPLWQSFAAECRQEETAARRLLTEAIGK